MSLRKQIAGCRRSYLNIEESWMIYVGKEELKHRKHQLPSEILNLFGDDSIQYSWNWLVRQKKKRITSVQMFEISTDIEYLGFQKPACRMDREIYVSYE